ncbi:MAG: signal peptidase I [Lachnospiraceae bacterium]|nr:signal peptidase I [Lachnospiraceae bacterium]
MPKKNKPQNTQISPEKAEIKKSRAPETRELLLSFRDLLVKLLVIIIALWLIFTQLFGMAVMRGESMYPRMRDGDLMIFYRLEKEYHIGDVVTFQKDGERYTARIVAAGGDLVSFSENGELLVNGNIQQEEIFYPTTGETLEIEVPYTVGADSYFLLCDFRTNAKDSRQYGAVSKQNLDGKVITILRRRGI